MRAFSIARRSTDAFGRLVCVGVLSWFAFQTFENIGMTLGLMPMTGVPLAIPFLWWFKHVRQLDRIWPAAECLRSPAWLIRAKKSHI